jgi:hypothetical protein
MTGLRRDGALEKSTPMQAMAALGEGNGTGDGAGDGAGDMADDCQPQATVAGNTHQECNP